MKTTPLCFVLAAVLTSAPADAAQLITKQSGPLDISGGGSSYAPKLSPDGSNVVFLSQAANLTTNLAGNAYLSVYAHHIATSNTVLRSASLSRLLPDGNSAWPSASSNAEAIAFLTGFDGLYPGDSNGWPDIVIHDRSAQTNQLVTENSLRQPASPSFPNSRFWVTNSPPLITADGRYVFFSSTAGDLYSDPSFPDNNGVADVYRYEPQMRLTVRISTNYFRYSEPRPAVLGSISPDGRRVAMIVTPPELPDATVIHVYDLASGAIYSSSAVSNYFEPGMQASFSTRSAVLSENGAFVVGVAGPFATSPANTILFRQELASGTLISIATNVSHAAIPQVSADGRYVAYETGTNIYRWDSTTGVALQVNVEVGGAPAVAGVSLEPRMSRNGNGIVFRSNSQGLTSQSVPTNIFHVYLRDMAAGQTHLITQKSDGTPSEQSSAGAGYDLSDDLAMVVFATPSGDLVAGDLNRASDIFVRHLGSQETRLISARHSSQAARQTGFGHALVNGANISSNGQVIAFTSADSQLIANDTNLLQDAFIAVRTNAVVSMVPSTNRVGLAALSGNGRYLATVTIFSWEDYAPKLFRYDRVTGDNLHITNSLVGSATPAIDFTGELVGFRTTTPSGALTLLNLSSGVIEFKTNNAGYVTSRGRYDAMFTRDSRFMIFSAGTWNYAFDRANGETFELGRGAIALSGNSRYAILGNDSIGSPNRVIKFDLIARTNLAIVTDPASYLNPSCSDDGRFAVFDTQYQGRAVLFDFATGATSVVHTATEQTWYQTSSPVISGDGRFVAYIRKTDTDSGAALPNQLLLKDRLLGTTAVMSSSPEQYAAYSTSLPYFAANGRTLLFQAMSETLVPGDNNDRRDIFIANIAATDSDGDGLDDEWELAYFNTLARNGVADYEGDGVTDRDEFLAGTDPTNASSLFRVLAVIKSGSGKKVLWTGNPALNYRLEMKSNVSDSTWYPVPGAVTWNGTTASVIDNITGTADAFYRVVRLP